VPLYEYLCDDCHHKFERIDKFTARQTRKCPKCGGKAKRQLAAPAIQFKGAGWYVTDYGGKSGGESKSESSDKADKAEKTSSADQAGKTEKKETKTEKGVAKSKEK
jgi:putative FmdB family regulatory protein